MVGVSSTDVVICGGGPAGLAAAIALRQEGLEAIVVEYFKPPIDKACGEGLMPDSVEALKGLGVSLDGLDTGVFRGIRFVNHAGSAEAYFPGGRGAGTGLGLRRIALHELLHRRAAELGVQFRWSTQVRGVANGVVKAGSESIAARWIVGADGMQSRIRKWSGLESGRNLSRRIGLRQHFKVSPWGDFMEVHWSGRGQAYVTPVSKGEVCIAFVARERFSTVADALPLFPELEARLHGVERGSSERGSLTACRVYDRVTRHRTALIGDASGSVDSIVGDGLALAFLQAKALSRALRMGRLDLYEKAHREIRRVPTFMSQSMLLMDRFGILQWKSLGALRRNPTLFERMLSVHVGATPLTVWGSNGMVNLGLQLLTH